LSYPHFAMSNKEFMKRRTFFAVMLGFATIGKWIANIIASEVKNAPKEKSCKGHE